MLWGRNVYQNGQFYTKTSRKFQKTCLVEFSFRNDFRSGWRNFQLREHFLLVDDAISLLYHHFHVLIKLIQLHSITEYGKIHLDDEQWRSWYLNNKLLLYNKSWEPWIGCNTTSLAPAAAMPECLGFFGFFDEVVYDRFWPTFAMDAVA